MKKNLLCFLLILPCFAWADRLSLKAQMPELKAAEKITTLYRAEKFTAKELEAVSAPNQAAGKELLKLFSTSQAFARGEIEDEKVLNSLISYLQLSCLKIRLRLATGQIQAALDELKPWFQFATELPYEESSLISLRTTAVVRSFLLDELETFYKTGASDSVQNHATLRQWLLSLSAPWPVDRVIVGEAKRHLGKASMLAAENLSRQLQKNPYQSAQSLLTPRLLRDEKDRIFLEQLWRDSDIASMKEEVTRIGVLQTRSALTEFKQLQKRPAKDVAELISTGLLIKVPLNYNTGLEMKLSDLEQASAAKH